MAKRGASDQSCHVKRVNRVDSGPCDHHLSTCVQRHLSERDRLLTLQHVALRGGSDQDWTGEISGERGTTSCDRGIVGSWDRGPRSSCDCGC